MSFLAPFALSLFALSVPLVLLYFLKVRRRERTVSSLLLWSASLRDREASTFFQRLHRDPLLLLQLLALLALALALARPVATVMGQGARKVVVVLDTSASMKAQDVSPSRFEVARSAAASLVRGLGEGAEVMVIEAGVQPKVTAALARDRERALGAIRAAEAHDLPTRLVEAVRTARALVAADPRAEIHVFTDGAFTLPQGEDTTDARDRWVGVGRQGNNVAITSLSIRKNYYGAFDYQAFVSLVNYSSQAQTFTFRLELDGKSIAEKDVSLEPNVRRSVVLPFSHGGSGTVTARIRVDDDLEVDNVAYAVLPPPRKIAVMLVSPGNLFLEKVLRTDPQVSLEVRTPDQYQGGMGDADVVVLDSVTPPRAGPGRFVFVNAVPPDVPLEVLGRIERPTIMDWDRTHPVMRHVEFAKVTIEDALRIRPLAAGRPVVEAVGGPLVYALEEPDRKALFVGFDLFKTDFPLRIAFPLVLSNTLRWLHPAGLDQSSFQFTTGQPILLPAPHGVSTVTVTTPSGRTVQGRVTRGAISFTETDEAGIYTLATARGETRVAVNLMNAEESNLAPHPLPTPTAHGPAAPPVPVQRELWPLFVMLAVILLTGEGLLYWQRQSAGRLRLPSSPGDRWALALRSALVAVLCLTMLRPTLPRWVDRMNVVFLLDMSDSVSLAARERAYRFVADAAKSMKSGDRNSVIAFGEQAVVDQPLATRPGVERPKAQIDGHGTNIFQAIQLALAMLPPGQANRIVMLTDGRQNAGNALAGAPGQGQGRDPSRDRHDQGRRRHRRLSRAQGVVPGAVRAARAAQARDLPVRRSDDARRLPGTAAAYGEGQDHGLDGRHRQGRGRAADGRRRQVGQGTLLLHRGLADDPAHLHPRDAAGLEGVARRAAVQAAADLAGARGDPGDRLEERAAARRLRREHLEIDGRPGADEPPGRPGARHLALRARALGRVHVGRQGEVGRALAAVARVQQVLVAADPLDPQERHAERYRRHRGAQGGHRRDLRRRGRPEG